MKLAVVGSRDFNDYTLLKDKLDAIHKRKPITLIVSGGAKGADKLSERWAKENNVETLIFIPDWNKFGKRAGFLRNEDIIKNSDAVVAFWDGESRGTQSSINLAEKYKKSCLVIKF